MPRRNPRPAARKRRNKLKAKQTGGKSGLWKRERLIMPPQWGDGMALALLASLRYWQGTK